MSWQFVLQMVTLIGLSSTALCAADVFAPSAETPFRIYGELLWLEGSGDDLRFATITTTDSSSSLNDKSVDEFDPRFHGKFGARIGGDYLFCSGIDLNLEYSYLQASASKNVHIATTNIPNQTVSLVNLFLVNDFQSDSGIPIKTNPLFAEAGGKLHFNYNGIDVSLGKEFFPLCDKIHLFPYFGIRSLIITENFHTFITQTIDTADTDRGKGKFDTTFYGAGPFVGFGVSFDICCNLSIFAKGVAAYTWGKYREKDHLNFDNSPVSVDANFPSEKSVATSSYLTGRAIFDYWLGVNWNTCFCGNNVDLTLAWENHIFNHQTRFTDLLGDINLSGLMFSAGVEF